MKCTCWSKPPSLARLLGLSRASSGAGCSAVASSAGACRAFELKPAKRDDAPCSQEALVIDICMPTPSRSLLLINPSSSPQNDSSLCAHGNLIHCQD